MSSLRKFGHFITKIPNHHYQYSNLLSRINPIGIKKSLLVQSRPALTLTRGLATASNKPSLGQLSREYGLLSVVVYCCLAFPTWCGCLYSITYLGVTQKDVKKVFESIKISLGFPPSPPSPAVPVEEHNWDWLPEFARSESFMNFLSNAILAMGMTKIFAPIKIGLTAVIVPPLGRKLKSMGFIKSAVSSTLPKKP